MNKLNHVAFIMDGNGRWGQKRNKGRNFGHFNGVEVVKKIVGQSVKLNIPIITFYVFSSENWKRPQNEKIFLFKLIKNYFSKEIKSITKQDIKINILGEIKKFSSDLKSTLKKTNKQASWAHAQRGFDSAHSGARAGDMRCSRSLEYRCRPIHPRPHAFSPGRRNPVLRGASWRSVPKGA